jgi:hypothetical protein
MSDSRDRRIEALQQAVVPVLRDMGFSGSFPHFRLRNSQDEQYFTDYLSTSYLEQHYRPDRYVVPIDEPRLDFRGLSLTFVVVCQIMDV